VTIVVVVSIQPEQIDSTSWFALVCPADGRKGPPTSAGGGTGTSSVATTNSRNTAFTGRASRPWDQTYEMA
jgi:hypothetical protein